MCPPDAIRQRNGGSIGSGARKFAATWPWRWSTGASGSRRAAAMPLGGGHADEQRADQPRALRDRDERDVVERRAGPRERVVDHGVDELQVMARGDLRHDAAERVVHALRGDDVGQHLARGRHHRRARVVAGGLEREDHTGEAFGTSSSEPRSVAGVRHMITASSPLSA